MSDNDKLHRSRPAPLSPSKYLEIQREAGSCIPQFKASVLRCSKFGLFTGIPLGVYLGYRYHPRAFKPFIGTSAMAALSVFMTFTGAGVVIATYNCLRVYT